MKAIGVLDKVSLGISRLHNVWWLQVTYYMLMKVKENMFSGVIAYVVLSKATRIYVEGELTRPPSTDTNPPNRHNPPPPTQTISR